jgi:hypothetical protein
MKINLSAPLLDINGKQLSFENQPMMLRHAIVNSLASSPAVSPEKASARLKLARELNDQEGEVNITTEQAADIKQLICQTFTSLVAGQAMEIIEEGTAPLLRSAVIGG